MAGSYVDELLDKIADEQTVQEEIVAEGDKNSLTREFLSSTYSLYGDALRAGAAVTGSESLRRKADFQAMAAQAEKERSTLPQSYTEVEGVGDALGYVGGLAAQSAPYLPLLATGGGLGTAVGVRAGLAAGSLGARAATAGGAALATYPSEVGAKLKEQTDSGQEEDLAKASLLAAPSAALNVVGAEGAILGKAVGRSVGKGAARVGVQSAAEEAAAELGQQVLSRYNMGDMTSEEAVQSYKEALVAGGLLGGLAGGARGAWNQKKANKILEQKAEELRKQMERASTGELDTVVGSTPEEAPPEAVAEEMRRLGYEPKLEEGPLTTPREDYEFDSERVARGEGVANRNRVVDQAIKDKVAARRQIEGPRKAEVEQTEALDVSPIEEFQQSGVATGATPETYRIASAGALLADATRQMELKSNRSLNKLKGVAEQLVKALNTPKMDYFKESQTVAQIFKDARENLTTADIVPKTIEQRTRALDILERRVDQFLSIRADMFGIDIESKVEPVEGPTLTEGKRTEQKTVAPEGEPIALAPEPSAIPATREEMQKVPEVSQEQQTVRDLEQTIEPTALELLKRYIDKPNVSEKQAQGIVSTMLRRKLTDDEMSYLNFTKILKDVEKQEAEAKAKAEAEAEKARQEGQAIPYVKPKKSPAQAAPKTEPEAQAAPPTPKAEPAKAEATPEPAKAPETSKAPARPTVYEKYKAAVAANRSKQEATRKRIKKNADARRRRDAGRELDANVKLLETQQQVEAELAAEKKAAADAKAARNAEIQAKRKATIARKKAEAETAAEVAEALKEAKAEKPKKKQPTHSEVIKANVAKRKAQMADVLKKVKKPQGEPATTKGLVAKTVEAAKDLSVKDQNWVAKLISQGKISEAWDLVQRLKNPQAHGSNERIRLERIGIRPTPQQVAERVNAIVKSWISPPKSVVMDSRMLPEWLQKQVEKAGWRPGEEGLSVDGLFTVGPDGKPIVVVFSDKMQDISHIDRVMMHEGMGHYGLRRRFGKRVFELLQSMYNGNAKFKRLADQYVDEERRRAAIVEGLLPGTKEFDEWMNTSKHPGGDIAERVYAMEEVVAMQAEQGAPTFGFYEKVRAILRDIGRKMNFVKNWTDKDVAWLMRKANLSVTRGAGIMSSEVRAEQGSLAMAEQFQKWRMDEYVKGVEKEVEALTGQPMGKSSLVRDVTERFKAYEEMGVAESAQNYMATAKAIAQKGLLSSMFSRQLFDYIERKNLLKGIREYAQAAKDKDVIARQLSEEAAIIAEKSQALGKKADPVLDMLRKHTIEGNWADARLIPPDSTEKVNSDAAREFNKLDPKQKELYFSMIKHNQKLKQRIIDNLTKQINDEEKLKLAEAKDDKAKERVRNRTKEYRDALTRDFARLKGPYMPLARFGNYVMVGRSAEMKNIDAQIQKLEEGELDADTRRELTKLRDKRDVMRGQAEHYYMSMHESAGKAREAKLMLEKDKKFSNLKFEDAFEKEGAFSRGHGPRWADIENIRARVKSLTTSDVNDADAQAQQSEVAKRINRVLTELYLNTLAETSARRHNLPRSGVEGASQDMMRAFIRKAKSDAGFISTMETNDRVVTSMDALRKSTTADATGVDGTRDERKKAYNEVLKRHYQSMEYNETPLQDKLMAASSFYMLLSSPRYFLMNLSQAPLVSVPYMGGRYGMGRSFKEWSKAAGEVYKVMSKDWKAAGRGEFNIGDMKGLTEKEKEFLQKLQDDGLMDIGINSELGSWDVSSDSLISNYTQGAMQRLQNVARQVEVMNRVSSGLAAFRMSGSTAYGFDVVNRTHFDYTKTNAPSLYNSIPKVLTQFRKYQLGQIAMFGGLLREAFTEADPKERWIAKKILFNTMGTAAFFTGAMSLPAVSALFFLSDAIFGDEDDPFDTEEALRKMIGDETLANFILKGTMSGAAGVDLSGSIGYAQMASIAPFSDLKMGSRDELYKTMGSLAGPWAGMAGSMADGLGLVSSGDTYKGVELMMPGLLKSGMRAYREEAEGITRRNGDVVLSKEEISALHTFWTALGFRSTDADKIGRYRSMLYQYEQGYKDRIARIKKDFMYAKANNDTKGMMEARKHWQKVQESKQRNGFKVNKLSDLLAAPEKQKKREYKYQQEVRRIGGF